MDRLEDGPSMDGSVGRRGQEGGQRSLHVYQHRPKRSSLKIRTGFNGRGKRRLDSRTSAAAVKSGFEGVMGWRGWIGFGRTVGQPN